MNYKMQNGVTTRTSKDEEVMLCNFTACILKETTYIGGLSPEKTLAITGERMNVDPNLNEGKPIKLPEITISEAEFTAMQWPLKYWGVRCIIMPVPGAKEDIRAAIQLISAPSTMAIYKHTGWSDLADGRTAYLHHGGGITAKGNDESISVELPKELRYDLRCPYPTKECIAATLALIDIGPAELTWPLLAATLSPLYGPTDFAVHITGRTGSFKSEVCSLFQAHYGSGFTSRSLPGSWSSSDNALEALAFLAKNAVMVIDDFVPHGSPWQQRAYQGKAERIFRAQGNQSGRQRLTDVSSMQETMYPRGCIISTGEDTPEGHSVRGRMLIREIKPGDISTEKLTQAQAMRSHYCGSIAWLAQQLAAKPVNIKERAGAYRDELLDVGHSRTPSTLGRMLAVIEDFLSKCVEARFLTAAQAKKLDAAATKAIVQAGRDQVGYLESSDPVLVTFAALRQMFAAGTHHARFVNGGIPQYPELLGWTSEATSDGEMKNYKCRGACVAWVSSKKDEMYIDMAVAYPAIRRVAGNEMPLSKPTLLKRMLEAGAITRREVTRNRMTARIQCEGAMREVVVVQLSKVLDQHEKNSVDEPEDEE